MLNQDIPGSTPEFTIVSELEAEGPVKARARRVTVLGQVKRYWALAKSLIRRESTEGVLIAKKQRAGMLGVLVALALLLSRWYIGRVGWELEFLHLAAFSLVLSVVFYLLCVWVLEFKVQSYNYLMVLPFPAIFIFVASLYVNRAFLEEFERVYQVILFAGSAVGLGLASYILIMAANIFNVASYERIPLLQVAQTVQYIFSIIAVFLSISLAFITGWHLALISPVLFFTVFLIALNNLWSFRLSRKRLMWFSVSVAFTVAQAGLCLAFWPVPVSIIGVFGAVLFYFLLGIIMHILKNAVDRALILEYVLVFLVVLVLVVGSAQWGLAGRVWNW